MRPDAFDTPEIQPAQARLILALALSAALHLALALLVQVNPTPRPEARVKVLRVDLAQRMAADDRPAERLQASAAPREPEPAEPNEDAPLAPAQPSAPALDRLAPQSPLPSLDIPLVEDPTYYSARQVDVHPAPLAPVTPEFPDEAGARGIEGQVTLQLLIDDAGVVREISVVEAQPPDVFEAAALSAFRDARFSPALRNGRPVKSKVVIKVSFELAGSNGL